MQTSIYFISQTWQWYIAGPLIGLVMLLLLKSGSQFGVSRSFDALCSLAGAGEKIKYFSFDWRKHQATLIFILGSMIGGAFAHWLLPNPENHQLANDTINALKALNIQFSNEPNELLPKELFSLASLSSISGWVTMIGGGLLIGYGARWAKGCTSGHAISGLANLQLPSLIAVIGFFIGGLFTTHLLFPWLMG